MGTHYEVKIREPGMIMWEELGYTSWSGSRTYYNYCSFKYAGGGGGGGGFQGFHETPPFERASLTRDTLIEQSNRYTLIEQSNRYTLIEQSQ